jgi:hypothetical protein
MQQVLQRGGSQQTASPKTLCKMSRVWSTAEQHSCAHNEWCFLSKPSYLEERAAASCLNC